MKKLINYLTNFTIRDLIYICIIIVLCFILSISINKCTSIRHEYHNNIEALNDSIRYLKDKNGNLVATKLAFESNVKLLKKLNENLYNQIDELKIKNSVSNVVYVDNYIDYPVHDTTYIVNTDTLYRGFEKSFNFNDDFRILEGNVRYKNDSLNVNISKDQIFFDYTVAMDKKNNIYVKSTNPYIKYNEISGFTVPKQRQKRWSLGPAVSVGYDPIQNKPSINLGVSLNYGIVQF